MSCSMNVYSSKILYHLNRKKIDQRQKKPALTTLLPDMVEQIVIVTNIMTYKA